MFPITATVREDAQRLSNLTERKFNVAIKKAMIEAIQAWHKRFLPRHFKRNAYSRYAKAWARNRKKKKGNPLVTTGQLKKSLTAEIKVTGTSKRIRGRMKVGRRVVLNDGQVRRRTFIEMQRKNIPFKAARAIVFQQISYGAEAAEFFTPKILAITDREIEFLEDVIIKAVVKISGPTKGRKLIRIR